MDMFKKITFVRFCFASASRLQEDLGLPTEKLICLYKECIEMAKHCNDIDAMVASCLQFVLHSNSIGRHADSLRCLKEILPSAVVKPRAELIVHRYLSLTYYELKEFDNVVFHAKKWIEIAQNIGDKKHIIYGHYTMEKAYSSLARYDDAIDCSKKVLDIAKEIDSAEDEMKAYVSIIHAYKYMQKYDDAILYGHKLLDCAMKTNDQKVMMNAYLQLGQAHLTLKHYQDAIDFGKKRIEIAREIEDRCDEVWAYLLMGQIYHALSDYDNAIIYCKKCIELAITIGDKHAEAHAYRLLAEIYFSMKKYHDAISNFNKCLQFHKEDDEETAAEVSVYFTLGIANHLVEKYDEAIQNYKQCINIVNRIGSEKKAAVRAYLGLGQLYEKLKQYNDAVYYSKKCIEMAQETGDKNGEMEGYLLLAGVYENCVQLNDACLSIDAGMAIATELRNKEAEERFKYSRSCLYKFVGLVDKACGASSLKELLDVATCSEDDLLKDHAQAVKTANRYNTQRAFYRLYAFYHNNYDYQKAINCLEQLKEMDFDRSTNLFCFTEIGNVYHKMGQNDMALCSFKEGLPTAESSNSGTVPRSHFYHAFGLSLLISNRELNLAKRYLREAIRCFEAIFTTLGSRDEFKISFFDKYIESYKLLAILLIKGEQIEEALLVLDRCRARALKDLMISNFKMEQEESNDDHLEYSDVLSLVVRNDFSICYYSLCFSAFLKFLLGGETNCSFSVCPNHSLQIYVDTLFDEMGVREVVNCEDRSLDKEQEDIDKEQKRSEEEYEVLNQPTASLLNLDSKRGESNENSAETKGSTLEILFHILECDRIVSSKQDEVVVIPEGPLYKVPFPALRDPCTGKYLSETKRIRLAPSLATLNGLQHNSAAYHDMKKDALVIGDPLVGKVMFNGEEKEFHPLTHALDEARAVADLFRVTPLTGEKATKSAVIESLKQGVAVVHIAAHGSLTKGTIALAPSPEIRATKIPDEEDYMLTMADVQQAQVRAQLVVLSCCHSGRGEIRAEGVVSMCRAFLASGARAVVASLWAIDDEATLEFMVEFYCHLIDGKSASTSLQQTMEEMRNIARYSKPKYWAPFFLIGDDVTLKF